MADPIQGLRASLRMADARDPVETLKNLNMDIFDLDRIRGIADATVLPEDIRTLSGLNSDVEKEVVGIYSESQNYSSHLFMLNDSRSTIDANISANAAIIASSFKFNSLVSNGDIVTSEVSTSRASAWSTIGDSLYYGAKVSVGNEVELSSLTIDRPIKERRFESEIPTHKVRFDIDGVSYDAFAMKNIPIKFSTFFSSARNIYVTVTNARPGGASPYLRPSWVVTDTNTGSAITFKDRLSGSLTTGLNQVRNSVVSVLSSRAKERDIEFFYPVDYITGLFLPNLKMYSFPSAIFPSMTSATLSGSDFREMPDFKTYTPSLLTLNISDTDLNRSDDLNLRSFNANVVNRLPTTLTTLVMNNCFNGEASANLAVLSSLSYFSASAYRTNNERRMTGTSPAVNAASIEYYNVALNKFSEIHPSVMQSDTLKHLLIQFNSIPESTVLTLSPTNNVIERIVHSGNSCNFINVSGKTSLKIYDRGDSPATGTVTSLFTDCSSLESISVNNTRITGNLPSFNTNRALKMFQGWNTRILDADVTYTISNDTFGIGVEGGCRATLETFYLSSPLLKGSIASNAMDGMSALKTFWLTSVRNGVSGNVPIFRQSGLLNDLNLRNNKFSGTLPSFGSNPNIARINVSLNELSGNVPALRLSNLRSLILNNNLLTGIGNLDCSSLIDINTSNNLITKIPSFDGCKSLQVIDMNSNPMTSEDGTYISGTFATLTSLRSLNLTNCGIKRAYVDQILIDLGANYDTNPRSNVVIDLTGNASPSGTIEIQTFIISRLQAAGWTIRVS